MTDKTIRQHTELDWEFDWRGEPPGPCLQQGETIEADSVQVALTGPLTETLAKRQVAGDKVVVWVAVNEGATVGAACSITCRITTSLGRKPSWVIELRVERG